MKEDKPAEKKEEKNSENGFNIEQFKENPWIIATTFLAIIVLIFLISDFSTITGGFLTGSVISGNDIGDSFVEYANAQGADAELVEVNKKDGLYEVTISMQDQEKSFYFTKDGKYIAQPFIPLTASSTQTNLPEEYTQEDLTKISTFIDCLAEKKVKIYGADWCGWTQKFVIDTLGGFDIASPIYVECTENEKLCETEGITGYPTTKIGNEVYSGQRTFVGLSEATGCPAPDVGEKAPSTNEASC